jgi:uncharacterized protein YcbX
MTTDNVAAPVGQSAPSSEPGRTVAVISTTLVKSFSLDHPDEVTLTPTGVPGNRRFFLVDERGRIFVGRRHGKLVRIRPELDGSRLTLHFPDGASVAGEIELGEPVTADFYKLREVSGKVVEGPWAEAVSEYAGSSVRLVCADDSIAYDVEPVTLVSRASIDRLAREMGSEIDFRRFRMLFTLDGCAEHEEDTWSRVRIGEAIVSVGGHIGGPTPRCAVVTQDPETGVRSLDTLRAIKNYRGREPIGIVFGVYARVEQPGRVRVGDAVEPL